MKASKFANCWLPVIFGVIGLLFCLVSVKLRNTENLDHHLIKLLLLVLEVAVSVGLHLLVVVGLVGRLGGVVHREILDELVVFLGHLGIFNGNLSLETVVAPLRVSS